MLRRSTRMRALLGSWLVAAVAVWFAPTSIATAAKTTLLEAAESGDRATALRLLAERADPNAVGPDGTTAIMYAAANNDLDLVRALIKAGANVKSKNQFGTSALTEAAIVGSAPVIDALLNLHFELAAYMIKAGADVDKWDLFGRSPLYMAADVSTLPTKGNGAMAVIPSEDSLTALAVAKLLLEAGANPNLQLKRRPPYRDVPQDRGGDTILAQGATPLLRAARAGDAPFVDLLLKHKALVDLPSKEGVTPLMAAAGVEFGTRVTRGRNRTNEGVLATMRLLLDAGADINARMVTEPTAVLSQDASYRAAAAAGRAGRSSQVPSALAVPHQTALHGAAERGLTAFVKFLAENGADLRAKDANGRTPLDLAKGVGVPGVRQAAREPFPETVALLESLMGVKSVALSSP